MVQAMQHQPLAWLDAQAQYQLAGYPVGPLIVPAELLDVAQIQEAQPDALVAVVEPPRAGSRLGMRMV